MSEPSDLTLERLTRLEQALSAFRKDADRRLDGMESALGKTSRFARRTTTLSSESLGGWTS